MATESKKKKYAVGVEVDGYCTKCKIDRQHVIETLKSDGNINRVICHTCQGSHLFRRPKAEQKPKRASRASSPRRPAGAVIVPEEELANGKPYAIDGVFETGDVILHKTFGPGSVVRVKSGGKMEVGFETGPKLMLCGSSSPNSPPKRDTRRRTRKPAAKKVKKAEKPAEPPAAADA